MWNGRSKKIAMELKMKVCELNVVSQILILRSFVQLSFIPRLLVPFLKWP